MINATAIIAPTLEDADAYARERRVRRWFYVRDASAFHGREPGWVMIRTVIGRPLTPEQNSAWEYAQARGWRLAS